jgi:alpha/beta superfamily hydrolase
MWNGMNSTFASSQPFAPPETALLRTVNLSGPAGRLEALVKEGAADAPFAALVCHPHPLGGGNLHNKVVYHAMKALNGPEWGLGWPVLRFNFRGVGLSQGTYDGEAEAEDVLAALNWLENEYKRPVVVVGFSFGAAMMLAACCGQNRFHANVHALVALGLPIRTEEHNYSYPSLAACNLPKLFLSGDHDQYAPAAQLVRVADSASEPKRLLLVPGADHFFTGQLEPMQQALAGWLKELVP